jgi:hypothetical protein
MLLKKLDAEWSLGLQQKPRGLEYVPEQRSPDAMSNPPQTSAAAASMTVARNEGIAVQAAWQNQHTVTKQKSAKEQLDLINSE